MNRKHATAKSQNKQNRKSMITEELNKLTNKIIGIAIKVHKDLGPGFIEKIYQRAMYLELKNSGISFEREKKVAVRFKKSLLGYQVLDFIIENELVVEIKAVSEINRIHVAQMLSYLKATNKKLGLILNFANSKLEIKRVANKL